MKLCILIVFSSYRGCTYQGFAALHYWSASHYQNGSHIPFSNLQEKNLNNRTPIFQHIHMQLMMHDYVVKHTLGKNLVSADILSCKPVNSPEPVESRIWKEARSVGHPCSKTVPATSKKLDHIQMDLLFIELSVLKFLDYFALPWVYLSLEFPLSNISFPESFVYLDKLWSCYLSRSTDNPKSPPTKRRPSHVSSEIKKWLLISPKWRFLVVLGFFYSHSFSFINFESVFRFKSGISVLSSRTSTVKGSDLDEILGNRSLVTKLLIHTWFLQCRKREEKLLPDY